MLEGKFSRNFRSETTRYTLASIVLICNAFIWYSFAFNILKSIINEEALVMWGTHFVSAVFSAIIGAMLIGKIRKKTPFLIFWMVFGIFSSLILANINSTTPLNVLTISLLFGLSFGLGLPASMGYFADSTVVENRAKLGGLIACINGLGAFLLGITAVDDKVLLALTLAIWRGCGLILFLIIKPVQEIAEKHRNVSFKFILLVFLYNG